MSEIANVQESVKAFLAMLESIPWFQNIGKPAPADSNVKRMRTWKDWPGPEEPAVFELSERQQSLYDDVMGSAAPEIGELSALWEHIHAVVFRVAALAVPYDPQQDAWHPPSTAVWQAAWTAGLVGLCLQCGRPVPPDLKDQWQWFVRGHWPSGYASVRADDQLGPLLVY